MTIARATANTFVRCDCGCVRNVGEDACPNCGDDQGWSLFEMPPVRIGPALAVQPVAAVQPPPVAYAQPKTRRERRSH